MKTTIIIRGQSQRDYLRGLIAKIPDGCVVEIRPQKRSCEQNAKLHVLLSWFAANCDYAGKRRSVDDWKRIFVDVWEREKKKQSDIVPSYDNQGVVMLGRQTRNMAKQQLSELIEVIYWYGITYHNYEYNQIGNRVEMINTGVVNE